jgi:hypothetical protein
VNVPESEWLRRTDESLRIVSQNVWDAAHARIAGTKNSFLRNRAGQLVGHGDSDRHLLSGMLACGSKGPGNQVFCGSPLIASARGRENVKVYICAAHRDRGNTVCTNSTKVPAEALHKAVIAALDRTFSDAKFEEHLQQAAANTDQVNARRAERENLLLTIPKLAAAEAKLAKAIAVSDDMDALLAELKAAQQDRKAAEARVNELEGYEMDLREQQAQVARLRETWAGWAGALRADVGRARQVLKKVLKGRILVQPTGRGTWRFAGFSTYDGALRGGLSRTGGAETRKTLGPQTDDQCRLMLHLLAAPASLAEAQDSSRRTNLAGYCTERTISGGSGGGDLSGPPCKLGGPRSRPP